MHFGEKMRMVRKRLGLRLKDLSDKSGIHYSMISKYENGDSTPSIAAMQKIANSLDVSIDYLMNSEEQEQHNVEIQDKELLELFEKADKQLDPKGKELVKEIVNAVITKRSLEKIMT